MCAKLNKDDTLGEWVDKWLADDGWNKPPWRYRHRYAIALMEGCLVGCAVVAAIGGLVWMIHVIL